MKLKSWIWQRIRRKPQVYLWPTVEGWWWLGTLFLLMMMGWGYSNNICLALGVLLSAVTIIFLMEAHFNLDGIQFEKFVIEDQFLGSASHWRAKWNSRKSRKRHQLKLFWDGMGPNGSIDFTSHHEARGILHFSKRGYWSAQYVQIRSTYPLGLFHSRCYLKAPIEAWVYPAKVSGHTFKTERNFELGSLHSHTSPSGDIPGDLRRFQESDPSNRISWKSFARGLPLHTKTFEEEKKLQQHFVWPFGDRSELMRSYLSNEINLCFQNQNQWSLILNGREFPLSSDLLHHQQCLRALASDHA
ncbi:MAG: DUF58 domain-containing protein [Bacteriovoracaceae bacterium]|nr:DUF58 domain-containing protein [Bacteriovoracaceae bacterium]